MLKIFLSLLMIWMLQVSFKIVHPIPPQNKLKTSSLPHAYNKAIIPEKEFIKQNFLLAEKQYKFMLSETKDTSLLFPRTINSSGQLLSTNMYDWTSGFFPGNLWYLYQYNQNQQIKNEAVKWTEKLKPLQYFTKHHDLGFMMYCSYGNAYGNTRNQSYRDILIQSAKSLSTRFNPKVGCIQSWNTFKSWDGKSTYDFPVIIDNMMNLELLFFASKVTGDTTFKHIAVTHAKNTLKNQIRKDFSSFHVICYDPSNGKVLAKETAQGYSNNSTWARGQAWGIYGFTMCYRETKDKQFLKAAIGMADWYINNPNLPKDKVPYWDFNANCPGYTPDKNSYANEVKILYRDASAAAVTASALLELSTYVAADKKVLYRNTAVKILHTLSGGAYRAKEGTNGGFILKHSVGSIPNANEIDVPLIYADYYFLEALSRYNTLLNHV